MPNDTGISDTCLYMEATAGDNGSHTNPDPPNQYVYWLSQDIQMIGTADSGTAVVGMNTTQVTVRCHPGKSCPSTDQEGNATTVVFELYLGTPSLWLGNPSNLSGYLTGYVVQIPIKSPPQPVEVGNPPTGTITAGAYVNTTVTWTATANAADPDGVGHKCMVARCYLYETSSPDEGMNGLTAHLPDDPHYAQHNLSIELVDGDRKPPFPIRTANPLPEPELVSIQATPDFHPGPNTLGVILPSLQKIPGFKQIATTPLAGIKFDLTPFKGAHESLLEEIEKWILDILRELEGECEKRGGIHVRAVIPPNFSASFDLIPDFSGAKPGDAHIYHVTQTTAQGRADGGLTVVFVIL